MGALLSVSVDLDGLGCYAAIHGQEPKALDRRALQAVPVEALGRLCALFADLDLKATFFAIGRELDEIDGAAAAIGKAAQAGHEIGSHSWAHDYALSRLSPDSIAIDLEKADASIEHAAGRAPRGFRAPGYTISKALLSALAARGYRYDSSLLPSPLYYAAKAAAIGLHAVRGRRSHSILGGPAQLFYGRGPRRLPVAAVKAGVGGASVSLLRELPVATLPVVRAPVIGTVLVAAPDSVGGKLLWAARAGGHVNLELHGIDVLDSTDGAPPELAAVQPGLKLPASVKLRRLKAAIAEVQRRAEAVTLEEAAGRLLP